MQMYQEHQQTMKIDTLKNNSRRQQQDYYSNNNQKRKSSSYNCSQIQEEKLEVVDLSGLSLESLVRPSLNLGSICKLDLSNNNLQSIPESLIARLLNVVVLDVKSNQLKTLPNSIGCLSKLKILNVSGNHIQSLPKTIENCRLISLSNSNWV
ncbi:scaffold/adaptor protein [Lithospermum erythrorhizon]|uniref:Scaffold/adaptor protein n=1 Tax=Lithospermum erythrorhizon TaxID=34254 RepID=A0AAV3RAY7_LITER